MLSGYIKKAAALSLGKGGAALVGIGVSVIMARFLSKEDVALYRQALLAFTFCIPLLELGVRQGLFYFLPVETSRKVGRVLDALLILLLSGACYALFILCGGNHLIAEFFGNPRLADLSVWLVCMALFSFPATIQEPSLVSEGKVKLSAWLSSGRQLLIGLGAIVSLFIWASAEAQFYTYVALSSVTGVAVTWWVLREFRAEGGAWRVQKEGVRELFLFSLPLGLAVAVGMINLQLDKVLVASMVDAESFAEYTFGAMEIPFIGIITGAVNAVLISDMRRHAENNEASKAVELFRLAGVASARVLFPLTLFLLVVSEPLMVLLYGEEYLNSAAPFMVYLGLMPVRIVVFGALMTSLGASKKIFKGSLLTLVANLILSVVLLKWLGMIGAAVATVITVFCVTVPYNMRVIMKAAECRATELFDFRKLGGILLVGVPPMLAAWFVEGAYFTRMLAAGAIFGVYYLCVYWKVAARFLSNKRV